MGGGSGVSTGQAILGGVGAIVGTIIAPGYGTMMGLSLGYTLGGVLDPPEIDRDDPTGEKSLRLNRFDHQMPVPVSYGRVLEAGNCIFVGRAWRVKRTSGGGKNEPVEVSITYYANFFVALCEGEIQEVHKLWRGELEVTDYEGEAWDEYLGTSTQGIPDEVSNHTVSYPHGWRNTAGVMWHAQIGLSPVLPVMAAEYTGIDTSVAESGSYTGGFSTAPTHVSWDNINARFNCLVGDKIEHINRYGSDTDETEPPSSITSVAAIGVSAREQLVVFLDTYDTEQRYAVVPVGDDGTHADVEEGTLSEDIFEETLKAYTFDNKEQHWIGIYEDTTNSKIVAVRFDIDDPANTVETWDIGSKTPANFDVEAVFWDQEYDVLYVCGYDSPNGEREMVRAEWGDTTLEEVSVVDTLWTGEVFGFGRSGDMIVGAFDGGTGKGFFRFPWDNIGAFETDGVSPTSDPRVTGAGAYTDIQGAWFFQEFNKLCHLDDVSGEWVLVTQEWDAVNWSWLDDEDYSITRFESDSCPVGAVYDFLTNGRYGGRISTSYLDVHSFEEAAGWCSEQVLNGDDEDEAATYDSRWKCDYSIKARNTLKNLVKGLLGTFNGWLAVSGGTLKCGCERPAQLISAEIDDSVILPESVQISGTDSVARPNRVRVDFLDGDNQFKPDLAPADNEWDQSRTGETRERSFRITGITDRVRAMRMARFILDLATAGDTIYSLTANVEAFLIEPGDVIRVNSTIDNISNQLMRVVRLQEHAEDKVIISAVKHEPLVYRTPVEDDVQSPTWGDSDSGIPNVEADILPIVRLQALEDRYTSSVMFTYAFGRSFWDGVFASARFTRGAAETGPFTKLIARGTDLSDASWLVGPTTITDSVTSNIAIFGDSLLGTTPSVGEQFYVVCEDEIIEVQYAGHDSLTIVERGARGTTAAEHAVSNFDPDAVLDWLDGTYTDLTSDVTDGDPNTYEYWLSGYKSEVFVGASEQFNIVYMTLEDGGKAKTIRVFYSSDDSGGWKELPGRVGNSSSLSGNGAPGGAYITFDMPTDWAKTNKRSGADALPDATKYYYIRVIHTGSDKYRFPPAQPAEVTLYRCPAVNVLDEGTVDRWYFSEEEKFTQWYVLGQAVGAAGQVADEDASPVDEITINDYFRSNSPPTQLRLHVDHYGPFGAELSTGTPKVKDSEDMTFRWNSYVTSGGFGQFGFGNSPPGYGGARSTTFSEFEYEVEYDGSVVRSGTTTANEFVYTSAMNGADNGLFRQAVTFRVRILGTSGITTEWSEITTEAF